MTYEESVIAHTDAEGLLNPSDAYQLCAEHGTDYVTCVAEGMESTWDALTILDWLGY